MFLCCLILVLFNLACFSVKKVIVTGAKEVLTERIIVLSGLRKGQSIFQVNPDRIRRNLTRDPGLADAKIKVEFPDRVWVGVTERQPFCQVEYGEQYLVIGADGIIIKNVMQPSPFLPLVTGCIPINPRLGRKLAAVNFKEALQILNLAGNYLRRSLRRIDPRQHCLYVIQAGSLIIKVELGNSQEMAKKITNLRAILIQGAVNITGIDLRIPDMPLVQKKGN